MRVKKKLFEKINSFAAAKRTKFVMRCYRIKEGWELNLVFRAEITLLYGNTYILNTNSHFLNAEDEYLDYRNADWWETIM